MAWARFARLARPIRGLLRIGPPSAASSSSFLHSWQPSPSLVATEMSSGRTTSQPPVRSISRLSPIHSSRPIRRACLLRPLDQCRARQCNSRNGLRRRRLSTTNMLLLPVLLATDRNRRATFPLRLRLWTKPHPAQACVARSSHRPSAPIRTQFGIRTNQPCSTHLSVRSIVQTPKNQNKNSMILLQPTPLQSLGKPALYFFSGARGASPLGAAFCVCHNKKQHRLATSMASRFARFEIVRSQSDKSGFPTSLARGISFVLSQV